MATRALNKIGTTHEFYWSDRPPAAGTVMVREGGLGYLVTRVRPARFVRAAILTVVCVDTEDQAWRDRPRGRWAWWGWRGHPKSLWAVLRR